jgi:hypothetical protein
MPAAAAASEATPAPGGRTRTLRSPAKPLTAQARELAEPGGDPKRFLGPREMPPAAGRPASTLTSSSRSN